MRSFVCLYSQKPNEILRFLNLMYDKKATLTSKNSWKKYYNNPIEIAEIIGVYIDNSDKFNIQLWICIDEDVYINITTFNANYIIEYLFERFPY